MTLWPFFKPEHEAAKLHPTEQETRLPRGRRRATDRTSGEAGQKQQTTASLLAQMERGEVDVFEHSLEQPVAPAGNRPPVLDQPAQVDPAVAYDTAASASGSPGSARDAATLFQHRVVLQRLKHAIDELHGATRQLESGLHSIHEGQGQHQHGLHQTLSTVEQLSASIGQVAVSAGSSAEAAKHADELAGQGRAAVSQAQVEMARIRQSMEETGRTVNELGKRATKITQIVDVIEEIADETNLLSLNAAIEAVHAGSAGRGFAIVANEVRRLSDQSATQAQQITELAWEIQREITQVTMRMQDSLRAVEAGSAVVERAGQTLLAIVDAAGQVSDMVEQISAAASQQAEGSHQIVEVSSSLAELAEQVSYSIDKAMMDSVQQQAALQRLELLSGSLDAISGKLGDSQAERQTQRYRWFIGGEPLTFDPQLSNDMVTTYVIAEVFVGLTRFGPDTRVVPGLAKAWDLSSDGRTWTFQLRRGATFHNRREVTAADVKYSLERILRPETHSPNTWLVEMIEGAAQVMAGQASHVSGIRTRGDYSVQITLEKPYHPFLANLAYTGTSIVPREAAESGQLAKHPVGAGPFRFQAYQPGERVVLQAHDGFYGGRPFLDEVELLTNVQGKGDLELLDSGLVDYQPLSLQTVSQVRTNPTYAPYLQNMPVLRTHYLGMNCGKGGPLAHHLVRQAINLAVNKQELIDEVYGGLAREASGPLPPGCDGYDQALAPYPFDLNQAKAKLQEAGYPDGLPAPLLMHIRQGRASQRREAELVQRSLAKIGITLEIKEIPWGELISTPAMQRCDLHFMTWIGDTGDPDNFLQPLFNSANQGDMGNRCFFSDPEVDRLLAAGQSIREPESRRRHYQRLQKLIHDLAPWVFICHDDQFAVTQPYVRGFKLHPLGVVYLENVWLDRA